MIKGIDISHWNGTIEWPAIPDEYKFAFMKATEGVDFVDDMFALNWEAAKDAGKTRGAYHFWRFEWNAKQQAEHFFDTVFKSGDIGELPPVIDIEDTRAPKGINAVNSFFQTLQRTEELFGVKPIIYTAQWYWNQWTNSNPAFGHYDLWVAHYRSTWLKPYLPAGWDEWKIWQHSCKGKVAGVQGDVDLNIAKDEWFNKYVEPEDPTYTVQVIAPRGVEVDVRYV